MRSQHVRCWSARGPSAIVRCIRPSGTRIPNGLVEITVNQGRADRELGSFFGDALPALSKATRGTVWAFEPNPQSFRAAQITALKNDLKNVKLMNCALGAHQEQRKLVVRDFAGRSLGGLSQIVDDRFAKRGNETIDIATIAIDTIVPRTSAISILHLDLEGFEEDAERLLKALGYRVRRTIDANTVLECD